MAFTKDEKKELIANYEKWLRESHASYVMAFQNMSVQDIEALRAEARETNSEFHVVKNTLMNIALKNVGFENAGFFDEASIVAFAFENAPSMAKIVGKAASMEQFTIKGGYMDGSPIDANQIMALAKLPPLPQMRAQLLAMIMAPASQMARTIAEPARQVAAVLKAYSEKSPVEVTG